MITTNVNPKRIYLSWTPEEVDFLRANYPTATEQQLRDGLQQRKWHCITKKATKESLERTCFKHAKLANLLPDTPEAFYWMGFLCADGNFTERRIVLGVATKDLDHLRRFLAFVESTNEIGEPQKGYHRAKLTNVSVVGKLRARFGIHNNKTHNPCNISWLDKDQLTAFFVGYADGDGCVMKSKVSINCVLSVVSHPSWLGNLQVMHRHLYKESGKIYDIDPPKIRNHVTSLPQSKDVKKTYQIVDFRISHRVVLQWLRRRANELSLPYMERKLGKIPLFCEPAI
jgi:hypothetical protein